MNNINNIKHKFERCIIEKCIPQDIDSFKIVAAVSGGADSVCMLLLLIELFGKDAVVCAHFNHKIRGEEAEQDFLFTQKLAESLGVEFQGGEGDVPKYAVGKGIGIEAAARELRYDFLKKSSLKYGQNCFISVAHNVNDRVETILHNISRGTSVDGLKGLDYKRGNIIRPLLDISREEIEFVCEYFNIKPVFDSTNSDNKYKRNLIRNEVIPYLKKTLGDDICNHILTLSDAAVKDVSVLNKLTADAFACCCKSKSRPFKRIIIDINNFLLLDDGIQNRLLRFVLSQVTDSDNNIVYPEYTGIYSDMIFRVKSYISISTPGKIIEIGNGVVCVFNSDNFYFTHKDIMIPAKSLSDLVIDEFNINNISFENKDVYTEFFDADKLCELFGNDFLNSIKIKLFDSAEYIFSPFGMKERKNLRKFLIDSKIGAFERSFVELVTIENVVLWIPGIRRSNIAPIDKNTTRVIIIKYISEAEDS